VALDEDVALTGRVSYAVPIFRDAYKVNSRWSPRPSFCQPCADLPALQI